MGKSFLLIFLMKNLSWLLDEFFNSMDFIHIDKNLIKYYLINSIASRVSIIDSVIKKKAVSLYSQHFLLLVLAELVMYENKIVPPIG